MKPHSAAALSAFVATLLIAGDAGAHEAWLLTPREMIALAAEPKPAIYTSLLLSAPIVLALSAGVFAAILAEPRWQAFETRLARPFADRIADLGPLAVRIGLAIMLVTAGFGLLPVPNVAVGSAPTLFVPDMQLKLLAGGWAFLAPLQIVLALPLLAGVGSRFAGLCVVLLAGAGIALFGPAFLSYAGHFAVPGLYLVFAGAGRFRLPLPAAWSQAVRTPLDRLALSPAVYRGLMLVFGANFAYLGITYKLLQPTLLIAILEHGQFPSFGIDYSVIAFVMTYVEIAAGLLLVCGLLVRLIAIFLICAFTMFALTLGETPLFHANLYAMALVFLMAGPAGSRKPAAGVNEVEDGFAILARPSA